jgi:hypothetical protein
LSKLTSLEVYQAAFNHREDDHPFDRLSAYKVRESRNNLRHELALLRSVQLYLATTKSMRRPAQLIGCTPDDMARRIKRVPTIIAEELGYNLMPAALALAVEGVSSRAVSRLASALLPRINALLAECDATKLICQMSASLLYHDLRTGSSPLPRLCRDALEIADGAAMLCEKHGV